jgi:hypothetical protein
MGSFSTIGGGISKLSELIIDADKDWLGFKIKNLGAPTDSSDALRLADVEGDIPEEHARYVDTQGSDIFAWNDDIKTTSSTSYALLKEYTILCPWSKDLKVQWLHWSGATGSGWSTCTAIYVNGVKVSSDYCMNSTTPVTREFVVTAPKQGDKIQVYGYSYPTTANCTISNYRVVGTARWRGGIRPTVT